MSTELSASLGWGLVAPSGCPVGVAEDLAVDHPGVTVVRFPTPEDTSWAVVVTASWQEGETRIARPVDLTVDDGWADQLEKFFVGLRLPRESIDSVGWLLIPVLA